MDPTAVATALGVIGADAIDALPALIEQLAKLRQAPLVQGHRGETRVIEFAVLPAARTESCTLGHLRHLVVRFFDVVTARPLGPAEQLAGPVGLLRHRVELEGELSGLLATGELAQADRERDLALVSAAVGGGAD